MEAEKSRIQVLVDLVPCGGSLADVCLLSVPPMVLGMGREDEFSGVSLERHQSHPGTSILMTSTLCKPNHLPKIPCLQIPSRGGIRASTNEFWGHTNIQSIAALQPMLSRPILL